MRHIGLIPRNRLQLMPAAIRAKHEYCFFLHDQCVQMLKQYEDARANLVTVNFQSNVTAKKFQEIADSEDPIHALRETGHPDEAKRVILNQITMAMVSDCLHHLYEGLTCFEKRKIVVALNVLRKPLKDNLLYLAWMFGDEAGFYQEFTTGNPERLAKKRLGMIRADVLSKAVAQTTLGSVMDASLLAAILYDNTSAHGLEGLFQHAVHLITVERIELRTSPENFNFIFKSYADDDIYHEVYNCLPYVLLFLSHMIAGLFNSMKEMDAGARNAFHLRSLFGFLLLEGKSARAAQDALEAMLPDRVDCDACGARLALTHHNAARIVMTDSFRCTRCGRIRTFPFSWLI
jgi:hypothetical protein